MRDLTLRQVEVIRAVMMTGTIQGAAEFLNVSPLYLLDATMYEQMMRGMSGTSSLSNWCAMPVCASKWGKQGARM